jgi:hypothetical protein
MRCERLLLARALHRILSGIDVVQGLMPKSFLLKGLLEAPFATGWWPRQAIFLIPENQ